MRKHFFLSVTLLFTSVLFLSFKLSNSPLFFSKREITKTFNPNVGIPMCGPGGALFKFDVISNGTVPIAPKLNGLGNLHFEVTTSSKEAQEFFDQGYRLVYAFNHAEALRSFQESARLDPNCAMAYWGQALAMGPNINDPLPDSERQAQGLLAVQNSKASTAKISRVEAALIEAMSHRFSDKEVAQQDLNIAYHEAMTKVYQKFADHPEAGTLYADAIMNTMPWDYWDKGLNPRPNTLSCVSALEKVIKNYPNHPGANHLYIHIIEAADPGKAEQNADILRTLMPGAGHLVHMPAHIYINIGRYADAADCNKTAIEADENYIAACQAQGLYPLAYYPHNLHFLWASQSMLGNGREAIEAAKKLAAKVPVNLAQELHFIQDFMSVPLEAYIRFGKWNEILTTPPPGDNLLHATMMWHYARGMAFVRRNMLEAADQELEAVNRILADPLAESIIAVFLNSTSNMAKIASESLAGEIAAAQGNQDKAIEHLSAAVQNEDDLNYTEPPAWHASARHYLGAVLIAAGRLSEAETVYRKDLTKHRSNGWALFGLQQCLVSQGKNKEAEQVRHEFEKAWSRADVALTSSRF